MASLENLSPDDITRLAAVSYQLLDNPDTRKEMLRLQKKVNPTQVFPELEIDERFENLQRTSDEKVLKLQEEIQKRDLENLRNSKHKMLLDKGLASSHEEIEQIEKFAIDNGVGDYEKAAKFYHLERQSAEPSYDNTLQLERPTMPKDFDASPQGVRRAAIDALKEFKQMQAASR